MTEWSALITVAQSDSQPAITEHQSRRILDDLGGGDSWIQYPPASGRGHGFETRWWQAGADAASAGVEATERFGAAVKAIGLETRIVLVHVTSPEERLTEATIGLERRASLAGESGTWGVMLRATAGAASERRFSRPTLERLLGLLPGPDSSGFGRDGMAEVRFWIDAVDSVDATERGAILFQAALKELGYTDWMIVRAHAAAVTEARRSSYLGVERRVLSGDPARLPIAVRI